MALLNGLITIIGRINDGVFWIARQIGWITMALMVIVIMLQIFSRFFEPFSWTLVVAKALMIWMIGLIGPSAFRQGGFVAIDILRDSLPRIPAIILSLLLHGLTLVVLIILLQQGIIHTNEGWGDVLSSIEIEAAWIFMALPIGFSLMISACVEMILKDIRALFTSSESDDADHPTMIMTE